MYSISTAGAGEQKLCLDALPAVGMEDTVHDTVVTESAESQPVQSEDDITNHPTAITYHVCLVQLAQYLLLPIPVCTAKDPVTLVECQATGPFQVQIKSRGTAVIMQWVCSFTTPVFPLGGAKATRAPAAPRRSQPVGIAGSQLILLTLSA